MLIINIVLFTYLSARLHISVQTTPPDCWSILETSEMVRQSQASNDDTDSIHPLLQLDATDLSQRIADGTLTSVELLQVTLDRIEQINPKVNAIILMKDREALMKQARLADATRERRGWLHGIPTAIKDLSHANGFATTYGGSPLVGHIVLSQTKSDPHVEHLQQAGAIIIGKTNTPEHGLGSHTFNHKFGTTYNSLLENKSAGGSSGGAAVALATHMIAVADGSDMMGSLRNPAGWNPGVYSHRPTAQWQDETFKSAALLPYPISTIGPMARSPRDLRKLFHTLMGTNESLAPAETTCVRMAWLKDWGGTYPMADGILERCEEALKWFESSMRGIVQINEQSPPFDAALLWNSWVAIRSKTIMTEFVNEFGSIDHLLSSDLKEEAKWEIRHGHSITQETLNNAIEIASQWSDCVDNLFQSNHILVLPTAQVWPFPAEWKCSSVIGEKTMDTYHRWMEVTIPCSLAGLPCTTVPLGSTIPMGLQLIGKRGSDEELFAVAQLYYEAITR